MKLRLLVIPFLLVCMTLVCACDKKSPDKASKTAEKSSGKSSGKPLDIPSPAPPETLPATSPSDSSGITTSALSEEEIKQEVADILDDYDVDFSTFKILKQRIIQDGGEDVLVYDIEVAAEIDLDDKLTKSSFHIGMGVVRRNNQLYFLDKYDSIDETVIDSFDTHGSSR